MKFLFCSHCEGGILRAELKCKKKIFFDLTSLSLTNRDKDSHTHSYYNQCSDMWMANRSHIEFISKMASTFFTFPMQYQRWNHAFGGAKSKYSSEWKRQAVFFFANEQRLLIRISKTIVLFFADVNHIFLDSSNFIRFRT